MLKYLNHYFFVVEIPHYVIDLIVCLAGYSADVPQHRTFIQKYYTLVKRETEQICNIIKTPSLELIWQKQIDWLIWVIN